MFDFTGKTAFVTGGSGGIGFSVCVEMARAGAKVIMGYSRSDISGIKQKVDEMGLGANMAYQRINVSDPDSVREVAELVKNEHGPVDYLVTCAGIAPMQEFLSYDDEVWRKTQAINLDGTFFCAREFGKHMKEKGAGAIVFIASIAGSTVVRPETHASYGTSKAAVSHLTHLAASELTQYGIRVNGVAPGYVNTEILKSVGGESSDIVQDWLKLNPMHRLIEAEEISNAVMFLLSDLASAVTGANLAVDAGYTIW